VPLGRAPAELGYEHMRCPVEIVDFAVRERRDERGSANGIEALTLLQSRALQTRLSEPLLANVRERSNDTMTALISLLLGVCLNVFLPHRSLL
jgi:hypothetical protein